ncbi:PDZ domain-containing protein [Ruminococcaceae bacterium OttesenSCG-928-L11]|nr:PDZ domain-containing protein [Ruminococcaceae bacterium OttesenSCG-928-L11]
MNKKISLGAAIAFMLIIAAATFSMTMIYSQNTFNERVSNLKKRETMYQKFTDIDRLMRDNYIGAINETKLMDSVAQGYLQGVGDKYGRYISAEEYAKMTAKTSETETAGIGVVADASPEGYLYIREVYPDSPALAAGMQEGDLIVKIDDADVNSENVESMIQSLQGDQGTVVVLLVRRGGEEFTMDMTRRTVTVPTVYANIIPDTNIAYIWIKEFTSNTSDQFNRELDKMLSAGAKSLVFDLRDNKGGVMRQATRILDRLVPAGVIYTAQRKDGTIEQVNSDGNAIDMPMAVLTNANTAQAAELFAAVLKDYDKARTVGTVTAGKGAMTSIISMSDGSALEITVAFYNPPVSPNFDGIGINPDFEVAIEDDWMFLDHETDGQLKKAMEVVTAMEKTRETLAEQAQTGESEGDADESGSETATQG